MDALFKVVLALILLVVVVMCEEGEPPPPAPSAVQQLEKKAQQVALTTMNETIAQHEIDMISFKREVMGRAGLQLYIVFLNEFGQPLDYFVTDGKCTSSRKRLVKTWKFQEGQTGKTAKGHAHHGDFVMPIAGLDGTFGNSDAYIYCKTVDGKYKQWNGRYYASDAPIELTTKAFTLKLNN